MRILVIEDNPDIAANLGDYLEERGHTVDFAADGVTGLHLAVGLLKERGGWQDALGEGGHGQFVPIVEPKVVSPRRTSAHAQ